jgi:hypothetical protein
MFEGKILFRHVSRRLVCSPVARVAGRRKLSFFRQAMKQRMSEEDITKLKNGIDPHAKEFDQQQTEIEELRAAISDLKKRERPFERRLAKRCTPTLNKKLAHS